MAAKPQHLVLADTFNWYEGARGIACEDFPLGALITPNGMRGPSMTFQLADNRDPRLSWPLRISKHATPGPVKGQPLTNQNTGVALPWMVLQQVDTRGREKHDPVYLGEDGRWTFDMPEGEGVTVVRVGKVLEAGLAPTDSPNGGVILLEV